MNGEEGVPIRPPALAELDVDSRDRYEPNTYFGTAFGNVTPSVDILYQAQQPLLSGYFTRLAVSEVNLQWRCPNINSYNNVFRFTSLTSTNTGLVSTTYTATLPIGFYNVSTLTYTMAEVMGQEEAGEAPQQIYYENYDNGDPYLFGGDVTPTYDIFQRSIIYNSTYTSSGGPIVTSTFTSSIHGGFKFEPPNPAIPETYDQEGKFWATAQPINTQAFNEFSFAQQPCWFYSDLAYTNYIDIVSDRLAKFAKVKDGMTRQYQGQTNVLARVFLTPFGQKEAPNVCAGQPFNLAIDYTTPKYMRWNPEEYLYDFDLRLYDMYGNILYWSPLYSTEYQLNLQASET